YARAGDRPSSKRVFLAAAEIAKRLGLSRELARAAAGYGGRIVWARAGGDERLVPLLEDGLPALAADDLDASGRLPAPPPGAPPASRRPQPRGGGARTALGRPGHTRLRARRPHLRDHRAGHSGGGV